MVLPITDCPSAPGQGALAVECRSDDETLRAVLASLDDAATARLVGEERRAAGDERRRLSSAVRRDLRAASEPVDRSSM